MAPSKHFIYGRHPVQEALAAPSFDIVALYVVAQDGAPGRKDGPGRQDVLQQAQARNIPIRPVGRAALDKLVGADAVHQGLVLETAPFAYTPLEALAPVAGAVPLYVLLDQVQDPHNLGAIARSALALGAHGLILGKDRCAQITATAIKAAAGATAHLPIVQVVNLSRCIAALKDRGVWIVGTVAQSAGVTPLTRVDFTLPTALVIRPLTAKHCDLLTHIPMGGIGSLNASVAASICLYEAARQRQATSFAPKG
jgi:23S rRNA (guanosine2251-2'-O)-methyltransferase